MLSLLDCMRLAVEASSSTRELASIISKLPMEILEKIARATCQDSPEACLQAILDLPKYKHPDAKDGKVLDGQSILELCFSLFSAVVAAEYAGRLMKRAVDEADQPKDADFQPCNGQWVDDLKAYAKAEFERSGLADEYDLDIGILANLNTDLTPEAVAEVKASIRGNVAKAVRQFRERQQAELN